MKKIDEFIKPVYNYVGGHIKMTAKIEDVDYINDNLLNGINLLDLYNSFYIDGQNYIGSCRVYKGKCYDKTSKSGYIYTIENKYNNKRYIGRTINPISRLLEHILKSSNYELKCDLIKYGLYSFTYSLYFSDDYINDEYNEIEKYDKVYLYNIQHRKKVSIP